MEGVAGEAFAGVLSAFSQRGRKSINRKITALRHIHASQAMVRISRG